MSENAEQASIASLLKRLDAKDATITRLTEQRDTLLAACEEASAFLDSLYDSPRLGGSRWGRCEKIGNWLRAAIAKAGEVRRG